MKKISGFTLIELMMTLLIAAVLVGVAIPSLSDFLSNRSLDADRSRFTTSLAVARSEAITRGTDVVVCPSIDGISCVASTEWSSGWLVFRDLDNNQQPNLGSGTCDAGEDCVIRFDQGMKAFSKATADQNYLSFNVQGERGAGSATKIQICSSKVTNVSKLTIAASGSVSIVTASGVCP